MRPSVVARPRRGEIRTTRLGLGWLLLGLLVWGGTEAWAGSGVVSLQSGAPSCADDSGNRYVDCGNGTVTDNWTGLVWMANANCLGPLDWAGAMAAVAGLADLPDDGETCGSLTPTQCDCGLADGSSPGEWRLPSIGEWEAMVADAVALLCIDGEGNLGGPSITSDDGLSCWQEGPGSTFTGVVSSIYWSSRRRTSSARGMALYDGEAKEVRLSTSSGLSEFYVWPVRAGQ